MSNKKHIEFYEACMKTGKTPNSGLCNCTGPGWGGLNEELLKLFEPNKQEKRQLEYSGMSYVYWASGVKIDHPDAYWTFTSLRQTIVLLMAAMSGEL
jgi:hypothetical protein